MRTCEDHSDCIVVFSSRKCPVCAMQDEIEMLEKDNYDLQAEVDAYPSKDNL